MTMDEMGQTVINLGYKIVCKHRSRHGPEWIDARKRVYNCDYMLNIRNDGEINLWATIDNYNFEIHTAHSITEDQVLYYEKLILKMAKGLKKGEEKC